MATIDKGRLLKKIGTVEKSIIEALLEGCQWVIGRQSAF